MTVTLDDVLAAREGLRSVMRATPLKFNRGVSERAGVDVFLKCENLQRAGSFKFRGGYTRISRLSDEEKARGVVAASAGNHAQGVALAAQMLGISAKVYMPVGAAMPKVNATQGYGAEVVQVGRILDESIVHAKAYAEETGAVFIHPFDRPISSRAKGPVAWRSWNSARMSRRSSSVSAEGGCWPGSRWCCGH